MTKISLEDALKTNIWVFQEAEKLVKRFEKNVPAKGYVLFETGYGPSGLPHIGTFAEVFRTTMVRQAFEKISDIPTKLFAFSDDLDGLRKVPDNLPNKAMISANLGKPLSSIPDPFGTHDSFGAHMNNRLRQFLDQYGFEYEFRSSTECYKSGIFDESLIKILHNYDKIQAIMLPSLGKERRETYSPFMPICPESGEVLQTQIIATNTTTNTITYLNKQGDEVETTITGGKCKLQWKPDWGMRWDAFNVDYEMHGKDLTPSASLSSQICKAIDGTPPINYVYEMFLDAEGAKISKSKGNGLSIEEWLKYGTPESLANYLFANPRKARRLHFDIIPKSTDEYLTHLQKIGSQEDIKKYANPVWHIHNSKTPEHDIPVTFSLLLNLASACNPEDKTVLWGFVSKYAEDVTPENSPLLDKLIEYAIVYYQDFVKPNKKYRSATPQERAAILDLQEQMSQIASAQKLQAANQDNNKGNNQANNQNNNQNTNTANAEELQNIAFSIGKKHGFENLRDWFKALYEILLGQSQGPRIGSFIALYGIEESCELINKMLKD